MTVRDRALIGVVAALALLGAFWFLAIKPKKAEVTKLNSDIAAKRSDLKDATDRVREGLQARDSYATAYATMARLGQAVPADDSVPSLVFQLDSAAQAAGVDFRAVKLAEPQTSSTSSTTSTSTTSTGSDSSSGSGSGSGSSDGASSSSSSGDSSSSSSASSTDSSTSTTSTTPAAPTQAATSTLPPGAAVGPAGFPTMPFTLTFNGSFFHMAGFLRRLDRFVAAGGRTVRVGGRLLTVEGISLSMPQSGFPRVKATVMATAYLVPPSQGATAGATPSGPSTSSTVSSPSGSPSTLPSATATPPVR